MNSATTSQNKALLADREFSVWVGDLSSDVDDYNLYRVFSAKYQSIKTAKVIMDDSGFSRGYGFVKFGLEEEQKSALYEMNGYIGLGSKALKICSAVPKPKDGSMVMPSQPSATSIVQQAYDQYSQYYDQYSYYWQQQQTGYAYDSTAAAAATPQIDPATYYSQQAQQQIAATQAQQHNPYTSQHSYKYEHDDDYSLVDYKTNLDIDKMNREIIDRDRNFYDSVESSKWQPLDMLETY